MSKKIAVVLDIDETLAHTKESIAEFVENKLHTAEQFAEIRKRLYWLDFYSPNGELESRLWGIKRPHLDIFLRYCFNNVDCVIVWSAGTKRYVDRMVKVLFTDAGHPEPHYVFSREDCYTMEDDDLVKPLKLLTVLEPTIPVDPNNMIIIDNKESNFIFNTSNALLIDDYNPNGNISELLEDDKNLLYAIKQLANRIKSLRTM